MTSEESVVAVVDGLNSANIPYMLTGSLASNYYGVPRSTKDADIVIQLGETPFATIVQQFGPGFRLQPQMSFETATGTYRFIVDVVGVAYEFEFFLVGEDPHDRERFQRRRLASFMGRQAFLPSPEDVIVTKLRWCLHAKREKDLDDIRNVIAVQGNTIDWNYIDRWCQVHGTGEILAEFRRDLASPPRD